MSSRTERGGTVALFMATDAGTSGTDSAWLFGLPSTAAEALRSRLSEGGL